VCGAGQVASRLHDRAAQRLHRLSFVISGTWRVKFGRECRLGGDRYPRVAFVPRVAHTPHFDGVKKRDKEPAVIRVFGQAPDRVQTD
jgi:hypothetical protein